jgi:hypothetical protein
MSKLLRLSYRNNSNSKVPIKPINQFIGPKTNDYNID